MSKDKKYILFVIAVVVISLIYFTKGFGLQQSETEEKEVEVVTKQEVVEEDEILETDSIDEPLLTGLLIPDVRLIVSDNEATRSQGLGGRLSLSADEGMIFVFDESKKYSFWMKDMNFPIDIIWVDEDFEVVHIASDVSPETYPRLFTPILPARYVIELSAGQAVKAGIVVGSKLDIKGVQK